jgi:hypothetical protein
MIDEVTTFLRDAYRGKQSAPQREDYLNYLQEIQRYFDQDNETDAETLKKKALNELFGVK